MGNSKSARVLVFGVISVLALCFQNCSGVNFQSKSSSSLSSKGTPDAANDNNDGGASGVSSDCTDSDCPSSAEEQQQLDWLNTNCLFGNLLPALGSSATDQTIQNYHGPLLIGAVHDLILNGVWGAILIQNGHSLDAQQTRGAMLANFENVSRLDDQDGALCLSAHSITEMQNIRGATRIVGTVDSNGQKAEIDHIIDARGAMYISNAHIHLLQNNKGALFLQNVDVDQLIDHKGAVMVTNGSIQSLQNVSGAVVVNGNRVQ